MAPWWKVRSRGPCPPLRSFHNSRTIFSKFRNSLFHILNSRKRCGHFPEAPLRLAISAIGQLHAALYRFQRGLVDDSFDVNKLSFYDHHFHYNHNTPPGNFI
jgi:hypothetical protein